MRLPDELDGWGRVSPAEGEIYRRDSSSHLGEFSRSWKYRKGELNAVPKGAVGVLQAKCVFLASFGDQDEVLLSDLGLIKF